MTNILDVQALKTEFRRKNTLIRAVNNISFTIKKGSVLSIVGESGSGKSVTMHSVLRLIPSTGKIVAEKINFMGRDLMRLTEKEMRKIRGDQISMIFQDPMSSLNPTIKIGRQISEVLLWHHKANPKEAKERTIRMLHEVGIASPIERYNQYPFEFSGGMRQRVMIAMALIGEPRLLIADEPTTSLDVTVQAQILALIKKMQEQNKMSVVLITHNLAVATMMADEMIVMYAGQIVEQATKAEFLNRASHPYTVALLGSTPKLNMKERLQSIPGQPPDLKNINLEGCPFVDRCSAKMERCSREEPPAVQLSPTHRIRCWLYT
ncbi:MAG: Oligopeptide transport ATP-binding protein OppD [Candidatus Carbobacillus altaicus]|uniref:Oligopeptide transport ATP-binding protein OppD n=1 Tax=Candidatus Carbonibacillus altaicus TaxID=2163959 RepID=A0A2R6Y3Z3_9BACL|nr:MAG: Oligopeptide transport ATP-binding protein OppD [Candidatus Carbobacillus altaicus]